MSAQVRAGEASAMAEMNITPLVDVMLVLLIIFMIAAPILTHRITLDLPHDGPNPPPPAEIVSLAMHADGSLSWNGAPLIAAALEPQLTLEAARRPQPELRLDVDRSVAYQRVATVLATARGAGFERIGFEP